MSEFAELRRSHHGNSWLDGLLRSSLLAAERLYDGAPTERLMRLHLGRVPSAVDTSEMVRAVQHSIARIAHHIDDPSAESIRVRREHLERAPVYVRATYDRVMEFGFHTDLQDPTAPLFEEGSLSAWTIGARAARELVQVLPETPTDDAAVDAILAQSTAIMNAVKDLTDVLSHVGGAVFSLGGGGEDAEECVLTGEQAAVLKSSLKESREVTTTLLTEGRLDGLRTKRRVFFLETDGGDMSGAFDASLYDAVIANMNKRVEAQIEQTQSVSRAGRRGRPRYRLLDLRPSPTLV